MGPGFESLIRHQFFLRITGQSAVSGVEMHPLIESHRAQLRNLADRYGARSLSVDIVTLNALHPLIRKRVLAEAIKL